LIATAGTIIFFPDQTENRRDRQRETGETVSETTFVLDPLDVMNTGGTVLGETESNYYGKMITNHKAQC
jgi:hypothetical protein